MPRLRLRTVASRATALTHAWPRWASLATFVLGCALATAGLHLLQGLIGPDPALIGLYRFGPAVAVGLLFIVFAEHHHRPNLATDQSFTWRTPLMAVVAVAIGVAIVVIAMAVHEAFTGDRVLAISSAHPLALLIAVQLAGALGEETAWRAYLQPELEQWWHPLPAAIGVGLVWGIWQSLVLHPPLGWAIMFTVTAIALSVVLRGALRFTRGNYLLVAVLFRAAVGLGLMVALPPLIDDPGAHWAFAGAAVAVAIATWVVASWRPSAPRTNDAVTADRTGTGPRQQVWTQAWGWAAESPEGHPSDQLPGEERGAA